MQKFRRNVKRALVAGAATLLAISWSGVMAESTIRMVPASELKILDPIWTTATITRNHGYFIYDVLFGQDENGEVQRQMVDAWEVNDDKTEWHFTLRDGLKFHDGSPVTSADVIASLKRWSERDTLGQRMFSAMESMQADGDNGFSMTFKQPFGAVLDALGKASAPVPFIMPEAVAKTPADQQIDSLIGSGPFTLDKTDFRPGDRVVYRKNTEYVPRSEPASGFAGGKVVNVDSFQWIMLTDPQTQANALFNGEVDLLEVSPAGRFEDLKDSKDIDLIKDIRPGGMFTAHFNHKIPPFDNPDVRKAAMLAVNQQALLRAQVTHKDLYRTCRSIFVCESPYANEDTGFFTGKPNFEEARKLLKQGGYDGKPVVLMQPSDFPFLRVLPTVYAQLLKQAGFAVDLQSTDWATLLARRAKADPVDAGGWNIFITYWGGEDATNPLMYTPLTGTGDKGYFGWPDMPELESLKTDFMNTVDMDERKAIAKQIQDVALDAGIFVPLGQAQGPVPVRHGKLAGFVRSPSSGIIPWNMSTTD